MRSNQRFISVTSLRRANCPSSSVTTPNEAKKNLLVFGVGYRYLAGINQAPETRIEIDFTPQFRLPLGIQAGDRSRIDLRFIEGSNFSRRYRNRINLQRTLKVRRFTFSPMRRGNFSTAAVQEVGTRRHFNLERISRFASISTSNPTTSTIIMSGPLPIR
jgi:hypothetical protein